MYQQKRSMISVGAKETLLDLIDEITVSLEELQKCEESGELDLYGEGAKAAFVQVPGYAVFKVRSLIYTEPYPARRDAVARWPSTPSLASGLHGRDAPAGRVCG